MVGNDVRERERERGLTSSIPARFVHLGITALIKDILHVVVQLVEGANVRARRRGGGLARQFPFDEHVAHGDDDVTGPSFESQYHHQIQKSRSAPSSGRRTMSHLKGHSLSGYPMDRRHARSQKLVLEALMVPGVVVEEKINGFDAVAIVKLLAGLEPFGIVGLAGAVGHRGS